MLNELEKAIENRVSLNRIKDILSEVELESYDEAIKILESDSRASISSLSKVYKNKLDKYQKEIHRMKLMYSFEEELIDKGIFNIAGIDEAGRGPLIGPVVAACVILDLNLDFFGINDSKKLSAKQRENFYNLIINNSISYGIGIASHDEIDNINILNATKLAMKRAIENMTNQRPYHLLIDAVKLNDIDIPQTSIIKGDSKSVSIAAASILAKVTRDRIMKDIHNEYPEYGFDKNMGYGTPEHYAGMKSFGITPFHRKSFIKGFDYENYTKSNKRTK